jgi:hypothetical protein
VELIWGRNSAYQRTIRNRANPISASNHRGSSGPCIIDPWAVIFSPCGLGSLGGATAVAVDEGVFAE